MSKKSTSIYKITLYDDKNEVLDKEITDEVGDIVRVIGIDKNHVMAVDLDYVMGQVTVQLDVNLTRGYNEYRLLRSQVIQNLKGRPTAVPGKQYNEREIWQINSELLSLVVKNTDEARAICIDWFGSDLEYNEFIESYIKMKAKLEEFVAKKQAEAKAESEESPILGPDGRPADKNAGRIITGDE